ncbi:MAG: hypothetical protein GTO18_18500, partial [Anaerolineales bacterium]|nr:hypothetical protein [Anaerolineales bacterium]
MTGPIPTLAPDETLATIVTSTAAPTQTLQPVEISPHGEYAVVWVPSDESLAARQPAGISGTILEELDWDARDVWLTENKTFLGSSLWLEISLEDELTGWVNAWNLTRYVPSEIFCRDPAVFSLLDDFQQIVKQGDAEGLEDLVDQDRGLTIRLSWYTPDVQYSIDEISTLFISKEEVEWGTMADSGVEISGSFEEVILTKLKEVFTGQHEMRCNQLGSGNTSGEVKWPDEFVNINYMSFFRPAEEGGNIFDWSTWAVGIE